VKNLVTLQEMIKNTSKLPKSIKEIISLLKGAIHLRESNIKLYGWLILSNRSRIAKLQEGEIHILKHETSIKSLTNKIEANQKIAFLSGSEFQMINSYLNLLQ